MPLKTTTSVRGTKNRKKKNIYKQKKHYNCWSPQAPLSPPNTQDSSWHLPKANCQSCSRHWRRKRWSRCATGAAAAEKKHSTRKGQRTMALRRSSPNGQCARAMSWWVDSWLRFWSWEGLGWLVGWSSWRLCFSWCQKTLRKQTKGKLYRSFKKDHSKKLLHLWLFHFFCRSFRGGIFTEQQAKLHTASRFLLLQGVDVWITWRQPCATRPGGWKWPISFLRWYGRKNDVQFCSVDSSLFKAILSDMRAKCQWNTYPVDGGPVFHHLERMKANESWDTDAVNYLSTAWL